MSGIPLHNGYFSLDNAGGTPTDYSAEVMSFDVKVKPNVGGHFVLGTRGEQQSVGGYSGDVTVKIKGATGSSALLSVINTWAMSSTLATYNSSKSFIASWPDNASAGSHRWSGELIAVDLGSVAKAEAGKGDAQAQEVKFKTDGNVTYAVI